MLQIVVPHNFQLHGPLSILLLQIVTDLQGILTPQNMPHLGHLCDPASSRLMYVYNRQQHEVEIARG